MKLRSFGDSTIAAESKITPRLRADLAGIIVTFEGISSDEVLEAMALTSRRPEDTL